MILSFCYGFGYFVFYLTTTFLYFLVDMAFLVTQEVISRVEGFVTLGALETFVFQMNLRMLGQICLLNECQRAMLALIRPLTAMHSHMVEEVMPFALHFATAFVAANEKTDNSFGGLVLTLENSKFVSCWHVHVYLDLVQIEMFSRVHNEKWIIIIVFLFIILEKILYWKL